MNLWRLDCGTQTILVGGDEGICVNAGTLSDLAPTLLSLLGLEVPDEMTGVSLISH
mgnify:CR=1 FL=1